MRFQAKNNQATLWIYDAIGDVFGPDAVTAKGVRDRLQTLNGTERLTIRINSPGGVVDDAVAIHALLNEHAGPKITKIDGIAASAATILIPHGRVEMARGSKLMIHHPWGLVVGNYKEMMAAANVAKKYSDSAAEMYAARSGKSIKQVLAAMDSETYFTSDEAVQFGLADGITGDSAAVQAQSVERTIAHAKRVAQLAFAALVGHSPEKQRRTFDSLKWAAIELAKARARAVA